MRQRMDEAREEGKTLRITQRWIRSPGFRGM